MLKYNLQATSFKLEAANEVHMSFHTHESQMAGSHLMLYFDGYLLYKEVGVRTFQS